MAIEPHDDQRHGKKYFDGLESKQRNFLQITTSQCINKDMLVHSRHLLIAVIVRLISFHDKTSFSLCNLERKFVRISGDFIVGALFAVHEEPNGNDKNALFTCGPIGESIGIQRVEAAFLAIDQINNSSTILPNIKLGIEIRDTRWNSPIALQQTIRLIGNSVPSDFDDSEKICNLSEDNFPLIAVVGPSNSESTMHVQNILQTFRIPQLGYAATSADLKDTSRFPYFFSLVPSDFIQITIMMQILNYYRWPYVSVVYSADYYGQSGVKWFKEVSSIYGVCIGQSVEIHEHLEDEMDGPVNELASAEHVNVIVCFCRAVIVQRLLFTVKRLNYTKRFTFIGSDAWASRANILSGLDDEMEGSIILSINSPYADDFDSYYFSRNLKNNKRNPWFNEFWQRKFDCVIDNTQHTAGRICTGNEDLSLNYTQDSKVSEVMKSIYLLAHSLHNMILKECGNLTMCDDLYPFNGTTYKEYLADVSFTYKEEIISFDEFLDVIPRYKIWNYQKLHNGTYKYVQIGESLNYGLNISTTAKFRGDKPVTSVCSLPCEPGYYKGTTSQEINSVCCWLCVQCEANEILKSESECIPCPIGYWPDELYINCIEIKPHYIQWSDTQSIVLLMYSNIGIVITIITAVIYIRYSDTPVVKSSTKELCYLMLFAMILAHGSTYAIVHQPNTLSCYLMRIIPPLSLSIMYSALLVKTNRIARILAISKKKFPNMRPRFMSISSQIAICSMVVLVQIFICVYLAIVESPTPRLYYPNASKVELKCNITERAIVWPFLYNAFLVAMCTFYAIKTRNLPQNFNESKFIGFSMYTTCITWVAFSLIYYGSKFQFITMCISISTLALVILVFLFFPKLYIILFHPEKNTRSNFITSKDIRCYIGSSNTTNSSIISSRIT